jgi:hypothetical protein
LEVTGFAAVLLLDEIINRVRSKNPYYQFCDILAVLIESEQGIAEILRTVNHGLNVVARRYCLSAIHDPLHVETIRRDTPGPANAPKPV